MGPVGAGGVDEIGIFDTIGYQTYNNRNDIHRLLRTPPVAPLLPPTVERNRSAPVYLIDSTFQTDHITRLISRVKKARLFFRSFDPVEQPRMSAPDAIVQVAQSFGVLLHLLPTAIEGAPVHNLRAAFLAGLAMGMDRVLSVMQLGYDPVPLDYRDFAQPYTALHQIDGIVSDFAPRVTEAMQATNFTLMAEPTTLLAGINIGTSSAENEMRDLGQYFIQTDAFLSTKRGEVRLVAGRKGSGKTAVFAQLRDDLRRDRQKVNLDLKPAGYQLLKFKESVLRLMEEGTFYHTITAFWEYLLLLDISYKLLEKDRERHMHDQSIYAMYRTLADPYRTDEFVSEGDFSERMALLLRRRLVFGGVAKEFSFDQAWQAICVSHIEGEDTLQYLIDRCLMRPRGLIDIVKYCRSYAVNLEHTQIQVEDIRKGVYSASCDLKADLGLEMRDVLPESDKILYSFLEQPSQVRAEQLEALLGDLTPQLRAACIENLLWFGFLGIVRGDGEQDFIYTVNYDMHVLNALVQRASEIGDLIYAINPAFWAGLRIKPTDWAVRR